MKREDLENLLYWERENLDIMNADFHIRNNKGLPTEQLIYMIRTTQAHILQLQEKIAALPR